MYLLTALAVALTAVRIFSIRTSVKCWLCVYTVFMTVVMWSTGGSLSAVCSPMAKFWQPQMQGSCWSVHKIHAVGYLNGCKDTFVASCEVKMC